MAQPDTTVDGVATPPQGDSPDDTTPTQPALTGTDTTETPDSETGDAATDDEPDPANAEAARWRVKRRVAQQEFTQQRAQLESERDAVQQTLDRTRQSIIDSAIHAARLDPRLLRVNDVTVESLLDDEGMVDAEALNAAIADAAALTRSRPKPNHQQGAASQTPGRSIASDWRAAFAPRPMP